jgi:GTP-binding protein
MFRITSAEFVISAVGPRQFPAAPIPEIAFAGRSNVGKSSLLNMIVGRRDLARTSSTPGKTQQINFFRVNDRSHLVDLPGYGYAKVSKTEREAWARLIEGYLRERPQLRMVVALSDIRHEPTALDREMFSWLDSMEIPFLVVLTKHDKVSAKEAASRCQEVQELIAPCTSSLGVMPFSVVTRLNRDRLIGLVGAVLSAPEGSRMSEIVRIDTDQRSS